LRETIRILFCGSAELCLCDGISVTKILSG